MGVGEEAATSLALVVHELATNSLKYRALSAPEGTLDVSGTMVGDDVEVVWTGQGGPQVTAPEGAGGYGSRLLSRTMSGHLGGTISHEWSKSGALVTLKIDGRKLAR